MENSAKALYMAGALLIAVMVISLFLYAYHKMGGLQTELDEQMSEQEITAFNKEYEAYNKSLMYGVDVISCINKAVSNDSKYFTGSTGKWKSASASGKEILVNVNVILKNGSPLKEYFSATYYDNNKCTKEKKITGSGSDIEQYFIDSGIVTFSSLFSSKDQGGLTYLTENQKKYAIYKLINITSLCDNSETSTKLELISETSKNSNTFEYTEGKSSLYKLTSNATQKEIEVKNSSPKKGQWATITWTTPLADFKTRKFQCTNIKYSDITGCVTEIDFKEK